MSKIISDSGLDQYILTPEGGRLLYDNPDCNSLIKAIVNNDSESLPDLFGQHMALTLAYQRQGTSIWRLDKDNLAIKVSNGVNNNQGNSRQSTHENLLGQMAFALWLNQELESHLPDVNILVPKQYLALKTKTGEFVLCREFP